MSGNTCFITLPKSAVDNGLMLIFPQKLLITKEKFDVDKTLFFKTKELLQCGYAMHSILTHSLHTPPASVLTLYHLAPDVNEPN
jgi:c-di-GMP-related signal transduction protein